SIIKPVRSGKRWKTPCRCWNDITPSNRAPDNIWSIIKSSPANMLRYIGQDLAANRNNTKGRIIALLFRAAAIIARGRITRYLLFPYLAFYKLFVEWFLGVELPWSTSIGPGLRIYHGQSIVINSKTRIGSHCIIRQSTTMGNAREG